jgi:hypothetical protein
VIYAFWAGLPVPPELALVPSKGIWSGQLHEKGIAGCLERYRPEQISLLSDWEEKFGLSNYLRQKTECHEEDRSFESGRKWVAVCLELLSLGASLAPNTPRSRKLTGAIFGTYAGVR